MFDRVSPQANLVQGEHEVLKFWEEIQAFEKLRAKNAGKPRWSFLDGPITANNPMGVHHAWGRTYKDMFHRFFAMTGHEKRELGFRSKRTYLNSDLKILSTSARSE
jgi:isoleucyl-tRNA synthetase